MELFSENYSYSYIKNGFRIKNVMISKRMVEAILVAISLVLRFESAVIPITELAI